MTKTMSQASEQVGTEMSQLEQLKKLTTIVADTGDFQAMQVYKPQDATTNPTLILKATQMSQYRELVERVIRDHKPAGKSAGEIRGVLHQLLIQFGQEILKIIPGRVSTETDADLSFDVAGLIQNAKLFIGLYEKAGVPRERILIKIASTWEGIRAAEQLEKEGIHCNMTLMFSLVQAVACAEAGATLISPFVGRILDWYKKSTGKEYSAQDDPGVESVRTIYAYYKKYGYRTEVMGASFRNIGEILELAGCDLLTISPNLLEELQNGRGPVPRKLDKSMAGSAELERVDVSESSFRWLLNEDAMATEKTAEGIRNFAADAVKLEKFIAERL